MTQAVYLQFPGINGFTDYLKNYCNIYEVGLAVRRSIITLEKGVSKFTYFIRLTKHASSYNEILLCDIRFWSDLFPGDPKDLKQKRDVAIKAIKDKLEKEIPRVKIFEAEFRAEPDL